MSGEVGQELPEGREASSVVIDGDEDGRSKRWTPRRGGLDEGEVGWFGGKEGEDSFIGTGGDGDGLGGSKNLI